VSDIGTRFDRWLSDDGPAALVLRQHLIPVEGRDGVLFPPTFAASPDGKFPGGYNIDSFPDGTNVCLVDSIGSQANRIEPLFAKPPYRELVPQVVVKAGAQRRNLLEAGHRAADALVRCSGLREELSVAFKAVIGGDAEPLAKIAPTSLVFGAWDSRDTQAKVPRLFSSTIRAFNIRPLTRSAQYVPSANYVEEGLLAEPEDKKTKDAYAERGFVHVPASAAPGGVIVTAGIRRDASLHLAALRLLHAGADQRATERLRRYVLGLALTAFTMPTTGYLRQGCDLVLDPDRPPELRLVSYDGRREEVSLAHEEALAYARAAAAGFGVEQDREVEFDITLAAKDVSVENVALEAAVKPRARAKRA
jgi:CRISPR-associated protein Csb1